MTTKEYREKQINKVQARQFLTPVKAEGKAKIKIISGDGVSTNCLDITWQELCSIKNILTI